MDYKSEFEHIYRTHYRDVFAFIFRTCGQSSDIAEELTQETFVLAYRCFYKYDRSCTVLTWLCAIAKNTWFHYLRKHKNVTIDPEILSETLYDDDYHSPDACAERRDVSSAVRKAIDSLPEKYREVVWLRCMSEMPFSQIADVMGITENSAKVLFFRAKTKLKEKLEHEGYI